MFRLDSTMLPKCNILKRLTVASQVYLVTLIADIVVFNKQIGFLFLTLILDILALTIIAIGIRGVALEIFYFVAAFAMVAAVVTIGQATTFAFRSPLLTTTNFLLDLSITGLGFWFAWILYQDLLSRGGATVIPNICIVKKAEEADAKSDGKVDAKDEPKETIAN
ncbi:unnamed protein product [Medioppia subpectinata]|uniref:Uncharacterized protein n=1 Tax=Medioppia subpectinata TaxID=1979941 RepID=A0A7R9KGE4_9ACAR|nr:unnamed protein product [Medioppia subpectinata]CAG2102889.1 unnamed protein product [Medioppia subpectinata]